MYHGAAQLSFRPAETLARIPAFRGKVLESHPMGFRLVERDSMLSIRCFQPGDPWALARIHSESWRDAYRGIMNDDFLDQRAFEERRDYWHRRLESPAPGQKGYLALQDGEPVGLALMAGKSAPLGATLLDHLHLLPAHRGRGIGTRLVNAVAAEAQARWPSDPLFLWCFEANRPSLAYYDRLGGVRMRLDGLPTPDGNTIPAWMFVWNDLGALVRQTDRRERTV